MTSSTESPLELALRRSIGVPVGVEYEGEGRKFSARPKGLQRPHGYRVVVSRRFSWVEAILIFDSLAAGYRDRLRAGILADFDAFQSSVSAFSSIGVTYKQLPELSVLQDTAQEYQLSSRVFFDDDVHLWEAEILAAESILLPVIDILHPDTSGTEDESDRFEVEGFHTYSLSKKYERSRMNRALAIRIHGRTCFVCGYDFDAIFGTIAEGYIEIHHLLPVSMMDAPAIVDPRTDLVPLCANCHRMAHRRWPPYTPEELRRNMRAPERKIDLQDTQFMYKETEK